MARHQNVLQVSVAAVECYVPHVSHHDVLHANIVLPAKRKGENKCEEKEEDERNLSSAYGHKEEG